MSMGHVDYMEYIIREAILTADTNELISDIIGVLEKTHLDALDKREAIKDVEQFKETIDGE